MSVTFHGVVHGAGVDVPASVVALLGSRRVRATIGDHSYAGRIAPDDGGFRLPLTARNRARAGVLAGDEIYVTLSAA